jgi:hypothetical protein
MYSGAGILVGRLKFSLSCQRYSNLDRVSKARIGFCRSHCILIRSLHLGARLWGTELCNRAIEQVDLVVEVHH